MTLNLASPPPPHDQVKRQLK